MYVKDINDVKESLTQLQQNGIIKAWELPYENLLTRLNAAIFFLTPSDDSDEIRNKIAEALGRYKQFSYRENTEKKLSELRLRVTFSEEELKKNEELKEKAVEQGA